MKLIWLFVFGLVAAQTNFKLHKTEDFQSSLRILRDNKFIPYQGQKTNVIHLSMNLESKKGVLHLHTREKFYLFINSSLTASGNEFMLSTDSLLKIYQPKVFITLFSKNGFDDLSVTLLKMVPVNEFENPVRQNNVFSNFILISAILLIIYFTALLRTNPQLTLDYLNAAKLFSLRDRDENQITLRITSSVNFLFYTFVGLLTSSALLVASHFSTHGLSILPKTTQNSIVDYFLIWILLAIVIVGLLMIKLGLARIVALLFGWRDLAGFQFFHFVRTLFLTLFLIGILSIVCFSLNITANYYFFIKLNCVMLSVTTLLLYFKLLARAQFSSFHLFSYLCATEFIPLIILIKVFLN